MALGGGYRGRDHRLPHRQVLIELQRIALHVESMGKIRDHARIERVNIGGELRRRSKAERTDIRK